MAQRYENRHANVEPQSVTRGTGATFSIGGDSYPYTIVGSKVSKSGRVTIFVTPDTHTVKPGQEHKKYGDNFEYDYTSNMVDNVAQAREVKLWTKEGQRWSIGIRLYRMNPHF